MRRAYIISYDIRTGGDYEPLYEAIKSYGTWARIVNSTWAVVTDQSAKEIREFLRAFIGPQDRLFVIRSGVEAAWMNVRCRPQWLKDNL